MPSVKGKAFCLALAGASSESVRRGRVDVEGAWKLSAEGFCQKASARSTAIARPVLQDFPEGPESWRIFLCFRGPVTDCSISALQPHPRPAQVCKAVANLPLLTPQLSAVFCCFGGWSEIQAVCVSRAGILPYSQQPHCRGSLAPASMPL